MEAFEIALLSVIAMLVFIYLGMHIAVTLALVSFVGTWIIKGNSVVAINLLWISSHQTVNNFVFAVIPLFVLMGFLVSVAGMGRDAYEIGQLMLRRVRGGLGMATVVANAIFAAITGVSVASASVFSKIAVPEMMRHGYTGRFAVGTVAGSSVLGMLIPPSVLLIIYALIVEESVGDLFIAGIGPGILLTIVYCGVIYLMARYLPRMVFTSGTFDDGDQTAADEEEITGSVWVKVLPIATLIMLVMGGLYGGVFTPVEAGAAGAFLALLFALLRRRLTLESLWAVLIDTGKVSATLLFLIISASMYSRMLGLSGLPGEMAEIFNELGAGFYGMLALYVVIVIILGTIVDSVSIMLIMVPLFVGALKFYEIDLIWFGIVTVIATEIGLLTPPLGLAVYVVHSTLNRPDISLKEIFAGSAPFALAMLFALILIIAFPSLSTFLVHAMK
ncbi:MAG: TRAP transporter large permease [Pseudomonadota bacterium]|jgi:C4-dicarboxylate transporter DctM subunit|nr:TRAP transporter large permease [Pseudomonadota bacterium]